ncbi:MAG TPA: hypothetical protein VEX68_09795 [Bryobacteraceae bacterium]|nr:hypothetical protein [Bryobacteraceae bacterium]
MPEFQHFNVKIFAKPNSRLDWHALIPIFHRWIREQAMPELLIDVADYSHVPAGPGVMVIGHEAHYSVDNRENRLGLLYNRRAALEGTSQERVKQAYDAAVSAARKLEQEPELNGALHFDERIVEIWVNDRLLAPHTPETFSVLEAEVSSLLTDRLGQPPVLERSEDHRDLARVRTVV